MTEPEFRERKRREKALAGALARKRRRDELIAAGLCPNCGQPAGPGRVRCQTCARRTTEATRRLKLARRRAHCCIHCGQPIASGARLCPTCAAAHRESVRRRREEAFAQGLCASCGKRPHSPGRRTCEACRAGARQSRLRRQRVRQRRAEFHRLVAQAPDQVAERLAALMNRQDHRKGA